MLIKQLAVACGLAALLVSAGCASPTARGGDDRLQIVTAFYPFQFVAERVAGPYAVVASLTQPGVEPHDIELTPRQVAEVTTADLVIYERSFQAAVDEAVAQSQNPHVLDTSTVVPLQPFPAEPGATGQGEHDEEHGLDPHVWLDPHNVALIADAVADRLVAADPAHAATYEANAAGLVGQLDQLDHEYRTRLQTCARTDFVTTHAAFGYLARRYGLTQIGISGLSPDTEPSPARIAEVQRIAADHHLTTIFYETLASPAVARSIADDLHLRTDVLDPIEGITAQSRGSDYVAVMSANLTALAQANGCRP